MNTLDLLLSAEVPSLPEKEVKVKRLSSLCGAPVVFKLRALPYNRVSELQKQHSDNLSIHIVLAGVVDPSLKDQQLLDKYGAATPAELIKKMLLPGEIEDISRTVERLSGYRRETIEDIVEIKKK